MPINDVQDFNTEQTVKSKAGAPLNWSGLNKQLGSIKQRLNNLSPAPRVLFTPGATAESAIRKPPIVLSSKLQSLLVAIQNPKAGRSFVNSLNPKDRIVFAAVLAVYRPEAWPSKCLKSLFIDPLEADTKRDELKQRFFSILLLVTKFILFGKDRQFSDRLRKRAQKILSFTKWFQRRKRRLRKLKLEGRMPGIFLGV